MTPEAEGPSTIPATELPKAAEPVHPTPVPPAPPVATAAVPKAVGKGSVRDQVAALPRFNHGLLPQSLVGSQMVEHSAGEWVRREDVLKLL